MAIGLGLVAEPLVDVVLSDEWRGVAPLLMVLAALSVFRPVTWVLSTYLGAQQRTNRLMFLEVGKVVVLLAGIAVLSPLGIHAAATAVGIAFGASAIAGTWMVVQDGPSPWRMLVGFVQPLVACAIMAAAVMLAYAGLKVVGVTHPVAHLVVGIVVGAVSYVAAALVVCRATSRDLLGLVRDVVSHRRQ